MKKTSILLCALVIAFTTYQCSSSKYQLQEESSLNPNKVYFQEWYAGIKVGGSGVNIYFPNLEGSKAIVIDSVYFRKMSGKLTKGRARYSAILKRPSQHYDNISEAYNNDEKKKALKAINFPFLLKHDECVISYLEDGAKKYLKIKGITEREGIYYEDGPVTSID